MDADAEAFPDEPPETWMAELNLSQLAKQDLGPSNVRREVLALDAAIARVPEDVRDMLENELRATFREVRPYWG